MTNYSSELEQLKNALNFFIQNKKNENTYNYVQPINEINTRIVNKFNKDKTSPINIGAIQQSIDDFLKTSTAVNAQAIINKIESPTGGRRKSRKSRKSRRHRKSRKSRKSRRYRKR